MTLRHIRIFLAVVEQGSNTTKAAETLHMTQPAISLALRELEQYYGVALFDRLGRRLKITEAGQRFQEYAAHIAQLVDHMEKSMRDWDSFGLLRVGASVTIGTRFLPLYVKTFYERCPGTEVRALVAPSEQLEQKILDNTLDIALIEGIPHAPALVAEPYMEDALAVIGPANGPFGTQMTQAEFRKQKLLLREPGSGTREVFDRVTANAGFSVTPAWEAVSTSALVNAAINGLGLAVLPRRLVQGPLEQGQVKTVRVEGLDFRRRFHIIYHREKYLTAAAKAFLALCRSYGPDDRLIPPQ